MAPSSDIVNLRMVIPHESGRTRHTAVAIKSGRLGTSRRRLAFNNLNAGGLDRSST